ncbi:MAG: hypothetical protein ACI4OL_06330 [Gemmiger sp.]
MPVATVPEQERPIVCAASLTDRQKLLCLATPLIAFAGVLLLFGVRYEVNDDALISCIASGAYGSDTVHLCYVNILIGYLLKPFYFLVQGFNWYVAFSVAGLLCCFVVWCRFAVHRLGTVGGLAAWWVFFLLAGFDALQSFQYTKNAALFAVTGALLLADHLGESERSSAVGGTILLLAGACLRWESFVVAGALSAPLLALRLTGLARTERRRALLRLAAALLLCLAAWAVNAAAYRLDPAWNAWREYNAARTEISDHRLQYVPVESAGEYGLSAADYSMLQSWDYDDTALYPLETLETLARSLPHRTAKSAVRETLYNLPDWLLCSTPGWLLCGAVLIWLLFSEKTRTSVLAFLATLAIFGAGVWWLFYGGRTPWRVEYLMLCPCALVLLAQCAAPRTPPVYLSGRFWTALLACCFVAVFSQYQSLFSPCASIVPTMPATPPRSRLSRRSSATKAGFM